MVNMRMDRKTKNHPKLVYLKFLDHTHKFDWRDGINDEELEDIKEIPVIEVEICGWLLKETEKHIMIAFMRTEIPKGAEGVFESIDVNMGGYFHIWNIVKSTIIERKDIVFGGE